MGRYRFLLVFDIETNDIEINRFIHVPEMFFPNLLTFWSGCLSREVLISFDQKFWFSNRFVVTVCDGETPPVDDKTD